MEFEAFWECDFMLENFDRAADRAAEIKEVCRERESVKAEPKDSETLRSSVESQESSASCV